MLLNYFYLSIQHFLALLTKKFSLILFFIEKKEICSLNFDLIYLVITCFTVLEGFPINFQKYLQEIDYLIEALYL